METLWHHQVGLDNSRMPPPTLTLYYSGESIADHMYRMSIMCMMAPASLTTRINLAHCSRMALVHDMAEALVGDLTPADKIPKAEKSRREASTMDYLTHKLLGQVDGGLAGADMRALWQEYEDAVTPESQFVHDIDKVEMVLQIVEYEKTHAVDLGEFRWAVHLPEVQVWIDELVAERNAWRKSREWPMTGRNGRESESA